MRSLSNPGWFKTSSDMVPGAFICANVVDSTIEPNLDNFGVDKDVKLYYVSTVIV
jgi:hypothetical protein